MARFFAKKVKNGSVFNSVIKNHVVEIEDPEQIQALRKEPDMFQEVADKKEAAILAASLSTSEAEKEPAEESKDEEKDEEEVAEEIAAPKKEKKIKKKKS